MCTIRLIRQVAPCTAPLSLVKVGPHDIDCSIVQTTSLSCSLQPRIQTCCLCINIPKPLLYITHMDTFASDWFQITILNLRCKSKGLIDIRVVTKISSCRVNTTSRRGIKRLGSSFGSIFLLFSNKSSRGPLSQQPGKIPGPRLLMTTLDINLEQAVLLTLNN